MRFVNFECVRVARISEHWCVRGNRACNKKDCNVDCRGKHRRGAHVVVAQQIKPGQHRTDYGTGRIAPVKETKPRHTFGRGFNPARNGWQRRAHHDGRRQQTNGGNDGAHANADETVSWRERVQTSHQRHQVQHQQSHHTNAQLQKRIHLERMVLLVDEPRQIQTPKAHATHEGGQQNTKRNRRRPNHELQQLKPHNFVNQRAHTAANEQQEQDRK